MKRFFHKITVFLFLLAIAAALFVFCIIYVLPNYSNNFLSIVNVKFDQLKTTKSPRIILISGSSLLFGLNQYALSGRTGLPVVNTGCTAGLGLPFSVEQVKRHLRRGDIVIAAPEYSTHLNAPDPELIAAGEFDLEYLPRSAYDSLLWYFPSYVIKKIRYLYRYGIRRKKEDAATDAYHRSAFDDNAQMIFPRPEPLPSELFRKGANESMVYSDACVAYLNSFNEYAQEKGATLLLSFPPLIDACAPSSPEEIDNAQKQAESSFNFPIISRIRDYIFPADLMYDTRYHCNTLGETRRTEQLADDVNRYLKGMRIALPR